MPAPQLLTATVSTKGQVVLPKAIRTQLGWQAGTRVVVESTRDGVLLKPLPVFEETSPDQVFGSLGYRGESRSVGSMDAAVLAEANRRHAGD